MAGKISRSAQTEVDEALEQYAGALSFSGLARGTQATYLGDARRFVRWLKGEDLPPPDEVSQAIRVARSLTDDGDL